MAELLTWEEKVKRGLPLSPLEEVKRDANRITLKRIRDNQEEEQYQASKDEAPADEAEDESEEPVEAQAKTVKKKGK